MLNCSIRNLRSSSNPRTFATTIPMQSATGPYRHYTRRLPANRFQRAGLSQGFVTDGGRQMASMATALAPSPQPIIDTPRAAQKTGRHFTDKKFADAPISLASKKAIKHE